MAAAVALFAAACVSTSDDPLPGAADGESLGSAQVEDSNESEPVDGGDGETDGADSVDGADLPVGALVDPESLASIEEVACSYDELVPLPVEPTCYAVSVPERWDEPDPDDQVVLQAAVFAGDGSVDDPIIYFDGGPGGETLDSLQFTFGLLVEPYLADRDFIVFDQRGVGLSEPSLACPELVEVSLADLAGEIAPEETLAVSLSALDACRGRLVTSGVDLEAYNSISSANDVEAMRSLLGYDRLNIVGISYGTRLAQTYMRMYPDSTRSVVLDSIFPTESNLWSEFNLGAVRAYDQLFDGCAASAACSQAYPDFQDRFFQLLDQLDAEPIETEATNVLTGETVPAVIDGTDALELVFGALYDRGRFSLIPQMVEGSLAGDHEIIELLVSIEVSNYGLISTGMQLAVECNEEIPFESEEVFQANLEQPAPYERLGQFEGGVSLFTVCEAWPSGAAPDVEADLVVSDVPALLLAGQYDPITPPVGSDIVQAGLANSYSFLLAHEGHGIAPTECGAELINAFIADPATEPDSSCVAASPEPEWVEVPDGPVEFVDFEAASVGVQGLRPEEWTDIGNGAFARGRNALDEATLVIQATQGAPPATLADLLASQLGIDLSSLGQIDVDGEPWELFGSSDDAEPAVRLGVKAGEAGVLVLLAGDAEEIQELFDTYFQPVAAAAQPLS
jgi:pimeloyl-ACP methyl ester carboxylesterase